MDIKILTVLLIIGIVGSSSAFQPFRTRRSVSEDLDRSHDELLVRLRRQAEAKSQTETTTKPTSTSSAPSTPRTSSTPNTEEKTSSTPKSTEQTPATTTPAPDTIKPRAAGSESSTSKPDTENPSSPKGDPLASRSNFNDEEPADRNPNTLSMTNNFGPSPMNSWPTGGAGWGQSSAGAFAGASANAGAFGNGGYFGYPGATPMFQGRSGFQQPSPQQPSFQQPSFQQPSFQQPNFQQSSFQQPSFQQPSYPMNYNNPGLGGGYYNPYTFGETNFADPDSFQRLMDQHMRFVQEQIAANQRAVVPPKKHLAVRILDSSNAIGGGYPSGFGGAPGGVHTAQSAISLGPNGGFQAGLINPVGPGVESRFAEDVPAPSGQSFGVFSSSSTSTRIGPDGQAVSHKKSTTGVNDNGKISFRTIEE